MYFDEEKKETLLELFRCRDFGAWEQVGNEFLHQMTKKIFLHNFYASGKVTTQMLFLLTPREKVRTRERKRQKRKAKTNGYIFKSDLYALKFPLLMLDRPLWGASTCRSRWETHLYFLKSRKGTERGRSIADRTCILNVTVRWLNRPLWGHCNSRLHTVPALTGSSHPPHTRHTRHLTLFRRDAKLQG